MNNDDKETLSQLMDGEWQDLDAAKSVKAACADEDLKSTWSRYHIIRDVIRHDEIRVDTSLAARISQAIADEPTYSNVSEIGSRNEFDQPSARTNTVKADGAETLLEHNRQKTSNWRAGFGGAAIAASVALATVVGLNVWKGEDASIQTIASSPAVTAPGVVLPEVEYVSNKGSFWVNPEAKRSALAEKRLNAMLSAHIERSPTAERSGMLPYSRLLGYDAVTSE